MAIYYSVLTRIGNSQVSMITFLSNLSVRPPAIKLGPSDGAQCFGNRRCCVWEALYPTLSLLDGHSDSRFVFSGFYYIKLWAKTGEKSAIMQCT